MYFIGPKRTSSHRVYQASDMLSVPFIAFQGNYNCTVFHQTIFIHLFLSSLCWYFCHSLLISFSAYLIFFILI